MKTPMKFYSRNVSRSRTSASGHNMTIKTAENFELNVQNEENAA